MQLSDVDLVWDISILPVVAKPPTPTASSTPLVIATFHVDKISFDSGTIIFIQIMNMKPNESFVLTWIMPSGKSVDQQFIARDNGSEWTYVIIPKGEEAGWHSFIVRGDNGSSASAGVSVP